ncbi:hypothetical protein MKW98_017302, partial [Papaver atlanticum]
MKISIENSKYLGDNMSYILKMDIKIFAIKLIPLPEMYEAFVCRYRKTEKVASGHLEQLTLELPEVKTTEQGDNFKRQLPENLRGSAWFTKSTLTRFLHIVGAHEKSTICKSLRSDHMSQLEEARRFHLELYSQGHKEHLGLGKTGDVEHTHLLLNKVHSEIKKPEAGEETDGKTSKVAKEEHAVTFCTATAK